MARKQLQLAVGLDIGSTTTTMVAVEKGHSGVRVVDARVFHQRREGILNSDELTEALGEWLRHSSYRDAEFVIGVPQYLADGRLSDFPAASPEQLREMVTYEAQQFTGLSDESFIHDYQPLRPLGRFKNPVLVGQCRESAVAHRLQMVAEAELRVRDVGMDAVALANACLQRYPEAVADGFNVLIDIGADNTTVAVIHDGQLAFVGSLPIGGDTLSQPSDDRLPLDDASVNADEASVIGSMSTRARGFIGELDGALEHWFEQHGTDNGSLELSAVFLSGGGAMIDGLSDVIEDRYHCGTRKIDIGYGSTDDDCALLPIAYGLALQGLDTAKHIISIAPEEVRWLALRRRRYGYLVAAVALFAVLVGAGLIAIYVALQAEKRTLEREQILLSKCAERVPVLVEHQDKINHVRAMLQPFIARGDRNLSFVEAIHTLTEHQHDDMWLVFMADQESYYRLEVDALAANAPPPRAKFFVKPSELRRAPPPRAVSLSTDLTPWTTLIATGFTPRLQTRQLRNVSDVIDSLNAKSMFHNVDLLPEDVESEYAVRERGPWSKEYDMWPFSLFLPLKTDAATVGSNE